MNLRFHLNKILTVSLAISFVSLISFSLVCIVKLAWLPIFFVFYKCRRANICWVMLKREVGVPHLAMQCCARWKLSTVCAAVGAGASWSRPLPSHLCVAVVRVIIVPWVKPVSCTTSYLCTDMCTTVPVQTCVQQYPCGHVYNSTRAEYLHVYSSTHA